MGRDLFVEGSESRRLLGEDKDLAREVQAIIRHHHMARVLFALWENGFYDYAKSRADFTAEEAAHELRLDRNVLEVCLLYLRGQRLVAARDDGRLALTPRGAGFHNILLRGLLDLYVGGYSSIVGRLSELLRGDVKLEDVARTTKHAAVGTEEISAHLTTPTILKLLRELGSRCVLDLGCGGGGFLRQLVSQNSELRGIGVDMDAPAIAYARDAAGAAGLANRLRFEVGVVGGDLVLDRLGDADVITAMYMLHEFGRDGDARIVEVVKSIAAALPGRRLLFLEGEPPDFAGTDVPTNTALEYWLVHPLSRQGWPMNEDRWRRLLEDAGVQLLRSVKPAETAFVKIYVAQL